MKSFKELLQDLEEKRVRDYAKEYREYQGLPAQLKKQSDCHKARRLMGLKTHDPREVDHIIPTSKGGTNETKNLRIVSRAENRKKSNKLMKDLEEE